MEANIQPRMKRKGFEGVDDDFSGFPLSPATKIRRLDAELPAVVVMNEKPEVAAMAFDQPPEQSFDNSGWKIEELPNEERAIVLYNPSISISTPIVHSPSSFSVSLHPQFISELKNQILRPALSNTWSWRLANDEDDTDSSSNECQAVVPWIPPRFPSADADGSACQNDSSEMIDDEAMGEAAMDVEDIANLDKAGNVLPQWPHCTVVQPPNNTTTPIVWYR